jgi:hypothetical protein
MRTFNYTKETVSADRLIEEIKSSSITIIVESVTYSSPDLVIIFKGNLQPSEIVTLDALVSNHVANPLPDSHVVSITGKITSVGDVSLTWPQLKAFYDVYKAVCQINFIDMTSYYYIWINFRGQKIYCPELLKADAATFEPYKVNCNILENERTRITTCKQGRKYHSRYISFDTAADTDQFDNTDYLEQSFGDCTYTMRDAQGAITTIAANCKETHLDFEPHFDYELQGGILDIPAELAGNSDDAWEVHVLAVPDIPAASGGCIVFIANPHIKWLKGKTLTVDASLNPSELKYSSTYHTNKIRIIIKHPLGAKSNFQINYKIFK